MRGTIGSSLLLILKHLGKNWNTVLFTSVLMVSKFQSATLFIECPLIPRFIEILDLTYRELHLLLYPSIRIDIHPKYTAFGNKKADYSRFPKSKLSVPHKVAFLSAFLGIIVSITVNHQIGVSPDRPCRSVLGTQSINHTNSMNTYRLIKRKPPRFR